MSGYCTETLIRDFILYYEQLLESEKRLRENSLQLSWMKHKIRRLRRRSAMLTFSLFPLFEHLDSDKVSLKVYKCLCFLLKDHTTAVERTVSSALHILTLNESNESKTEKEQLFHFCKSVVENFSTNFIKFPESKSNFEKLLHGFKEFLNFPHCFGVAGVCRFSTESYALSAVCDYAHRFLHIDVTPFGNYTNEQIFDCSTLNDFLMQENISQLIKSQAENTILPCIIADSSFPLKGNLLTPYTGNEMITEKEILFNEKLAVVQRIIRQAFNKLKLRFPCLDNSNMYIDSTLIQTCCILHNICEILGDTIESELLDDYHEETQFSPTTTLDAIAMREQFLQVLIPS